MKRVALAATLTTALAVLPQAEAAMEVKQVQMRIPAM